MLARSRKHGTHSAVKSWHSYEVHENADCWGATLQRRGISRGSFRNEMFQESRKLPDFGKLRSFGSSSEQIRRDQHITLETGNVQRLLGKHLSKLDQGWCRARCQAAELCAIFRAALHEVAVNPSPAIVKLFGLLASLSGS